MAEAAHTTAAPAASNIIRLGLPRPPRGRWNIQSSAPTELPEHVVSLRAERIARGLERPLPAPQTPSPEMELLTALLDELSVKKGGLFYQVSQRLAATTRPSAVAALNAYFDVRRLNRHAIISGEKH